MTAEAIVLHYLDNLDAKMQTVRSELARAEASGRRGDEMTEWVRPLERQLLNTQAFLGIAGSEPKSPVESAVVAETVIVEKTELALNGKREEREEERNHALPFED